MVVLYNDYVIDQDLFKGQGDIKVNDSLSLRYLIQNEFQQETQEYNDYNVILNFQSPILTLVILWIILHSCQRNKTPSLLLTARVIPNNIMQSTGDYYCMDNRLNIDNMDMIRTLSFLHEGLEVVHERVVTYVEDGKRYVLNTSIPLPLLLGIPLACRCCRLK